jgi:hypothetical protein
VDVAPLRAPHVAALPLLLLVRPDDERLVDLRHARFDAEALFSPRLLVHLRRVIAILTLPRRDLLRAPVVFSMLRLELFEFPRVLVLQRAHHLRNRNRKQKQE